MHTNKGAYTNDEIEALDLLHTTALHTLAQKLSCSKQTHAKWRTPALQV